MKPRGAGSSDRKIRLKTLNPCITCMLCKGYMIEATTITECLHTFCKSCIVKFLEENNTCPKCGLVIHQSHPLNYISHDRTMHDIVFKLVPNLREDEIRREDDFYKSNGIPNPKISTDEKENSTSPETTNRHIPGNQAAPGGDDDDYHRSDEQVSVCLDCYQGQLQQLKRKYIRCSVQTTITHLKKFLALKLFNDMSKFRELEVMCQQEILGKDHTLKFICMTRWRNKDAPLQLYYRPKLEL
ncbi:hypothetical protein HELRODRAFT_186448 [Helobdella robusta]|uniref:RING-type domain-containing protein n=1 Tax=Helobdella robusta TaxID=6412 RepID=T1FNZ7_HELRO|nr:hypothetical protein HELRODRAFT_186448 [Helobdella robusta]ESO02566.1 hypothetical protein HELRODRAFT_186448 [Helobdella robusta]